MKSFLSRLWSYLVNWFERADLVPLLVIVSAVHYAAVLNGKDIWPVAVAIGLLVDLGHYRTVRAAVRYSGSFWHAVARWLIAAGMTALSLNYHQRFYEDWWLSVPLPLLIAALAWLQQVDSRAGPRKPAEASQVEPDQSQQPSQPERNLVCSCGYRARSLAALNAHKRIHSNGKVAKAEKVAADEKL
jgi:hypothetical protein